MTDKMNLNAANARPSPPSITGEPGAAAIARATGGVGDRASSPARDNSLLPERMTLLSSGESRNPGKYDGQPHLLDGGILGRDCHISGAIAAAPAGGLISRAIDLLAEWENTPKEGDPMIDVLLGVIGEALGLLRALPAAAQGATSCELCGSLIKEGNCFCNWSPAQGEPVAWRYRYADGGAWSHPEYKRRSSYGRIGHEEQPLYAHPSDASLQAEVERLRKMVKNLNAAWESCIVEREAAEARIAELEAERDRLLAVERLYDTAVQLAAIESREGALEQAKTGAVTGEMSDLLERLDAGVLASGMHEDNSTELFMVDDASDTMAEAAAALRSVLAGAVTVKPATLIQSEGYDLDAMKAALQMHPDTKSGCTYRLFWIAEHEAAALTGAEGEG